MHKIEEIPDSEIERVVHDIKFDGSRLISKYQAADGTWTIIIGSPGSNDKDDQQMYKNEEKDSHHKNIAWGKKVKDIHGSVFKERVIEISEKLDIDPNHLMSTMAFETGRTFSPNVLNMAGSGAVGLIQFMPSTAHSLGTSTAQLKAMSAIEQLSYVKKYFKKWTKNRSLISLSDVYMAVLYPKAIGKLESYILFALGSKSYDQNKGLDINSDGKITKAEAAHKVEQMLVEGMRTENIG